MELWQILDGSGRNTLPVWLECLKRQTRRVYRPRRLANVQRSRVSALMSGASALCICIRGCNASGAAALKPNTSRFNGGSNTAGRSPSHVHVLSSFHRLQNFNDFRRNMLAFPRSLEHRGRCVPRCDLHPPSKSNRNYFLAAPRRIPPIAGRRLVVSDAGWR